MQIRWSNLIGLALLITAVVVLTQNVGEIGAFLATIRQLSPGNSMEEQTIGLVSFGVVVISTLAAIRVFRSRRRNDEH